MRMKSLYVLPIVVASFIFMLVTACTKDEVDFSTSIHGIISNSETGQTVSGAEVSLMPIGKTIVSGGDGSFFFSGIEAGQYTLLVRKEGFEDARKMVTTVAGKEAKADIVITPIEEKSEYELSTTTLNFTADVTTLSFEIKNTGTTNMTWSLSSVPAWMTFTPSQGTIKAGKSVSIVAKVDLAKQTSSTSDIVIINTDSDSKTLNVNLTIEERDAFSLSRSTLDFGCYSEELVFTITNELNSSISWSSQNLPAWLKLSPSQGSLAANGSSTITAKADRNKVSSASTAVIILQSGSFQKAMTVSIDVEDVQPLNISTNYIDFGTSCDETSMVISNVTTQTTNYRFTNVPKWIKVQDSAGTLGAKMSKTIVLKTDRSQVTGTASATIDIQSGSSYQYNDQLIVSIDNPSPNTGDDNGGSTGNEDYSGVSVDCGTLRYLDAEIVSCRRSGNTVTMVYLLTNTAEKVQSTSVYPGDKTTISDNNGNQYAKSNVLVDIGGKNSGYGNWVQGNLQPGVPCKITITVKNVDSKAKKMHYSIWTSTAMGMNYTGYVTIKNVPIY